MIHSLGVIVVGDDPEAANRTIAALRATPTGEEVQVEWVRDLVRDGVQLDCTPFVALVRAGDQPAASALTAIRSTLENHPELDVLYGDHDELDAAGRRSNPFHKPAWSPERLWARNYLGSMVTYRASSVAATLAGLRHRPGLGAETQLHRLALAVTARAEVIAHIPRVLCHRAPTASRDDDGRLFTEQEHFERIGLPARAVLQPSGILAFEPRLDDVSPLVSIVIPTGGSKRTVRGESLLLVDHAIRSLVATSTYGNVEIVVVVDAKSSNELAQGLAALDDRVRIVKDDRPFNFAAACNLGVDASAGSLIVLLNDDTEVVTPDWIERLITLTTLDDIGAVGVKLFYADGRVQHGGVATRGTGPDHVYHGYPGHDPGHGGWLQSTVNCFAATGACLAIRRDHWDAVSGMDEGFPLNYNDIDLCLRLHARGWRTVVDNHTHLLHLETSSRPAGSENWEVEAFRDRWGRWLSTDPYDNPNLVTVGLQQVPPPAALTALAEHRGRTHHTPRIWTDTLGFGFAVDEGDHPDH